MSGQPAIMPKTRGNDYGTEHTLHKRLIFGSLVWFICSLLIFFIFFYLGSYNPSSYSVKKQEQEN